MARKDVAAPSTVAKALPPYEKIKAAISDGTFPPGHALVESALAEWCGVSRTPVREALTRLLQDGLVTKTDRGMMVREQSPDEILDIYEARISLEVTAARVAAERYTPVDKLRLERTATLEMEAARSPERWADRNRDFHKAIWTATHNDTLIDLLERLNLHLARYPVTTLAAPGRWKESLEEHRSLVAAILEKDPVLAAKMAEQHFSRARDIRLKLWEQSIG